MILNVVSSLIFPEDGHCLTAIYFIKALDLGQTKHLIFKINNIIDIQNKISL